MPHAAETCGVGKKRELYQNVKMIFLSMTIGLISKRYQCQLQKPPSFPLCVNQIAHNIVYFDATCLHPLLLPDNLFLNILYLRFYSIYKWSEVKQQ